jgi:hypothetical protein
MKRTATALALIVAGLALTACGKATAPEPLSPPVTPRVVASGVPVHAASVAPSAVESEPSATCWEAWGPEDLAWMDRIHQVSTYEAQLAIYRDLPPSTTGCDQTSRDLLDSRHADAERIAAYLATHD